MILQGALRASFGLYILNSIKYDWHIGLIKIAYAGRTNTLTEHCSRYTLCHQKITTRECYIYSNLHELLLALKSKHDALWDLPGS